MTFIEFLKYILLLVFFPRSLKTMEWRMLRLLNKDRKYYGGLGPVRMQSDLRDVARKHSLDMAQKDFFDHVNLKSQSPADRLKLSGVTESVSGENLAKIGGYSNPTQYAENGLMNSPGHRANILNGSYNVVGIGIIQSKNGVYYFTQNFAKRDLVFKNSFPKTIRLKRGIHFKGEIFSKIKLILFQINLVNHKNILEEKVLKVKNKNFNFKIDFPDIGIYEISLFVDHIGKGKFDLSNKFQVKVRKGWLF